MKLSARKRSMSSIFSCLHFVPLRNKDATQVLIKWDSRPNVAISVFFCTSPRQNAQIKTADFHMLGRADDLFISISWLFRVIETPDVANDLYKGGQAKTKKRGSVAVTLFLSRRNIAQLGFARIIKFIMGSLAILFFWKNGWWWS